MANNHRRFKSAEHHVGSQTRWSLVLRACAGSAEAVEELAKSYWPVLFSFLQRKGLSPSDAEDLTQETLARLMKDGCLPVVDRTKGRFRSYLFACAEHEASHFRERHAAKKRGADKTLALDFSKLDALAALLPATEPATAHTFDRAWSKVVVSRAIDKISREYERLGKRILFNELLPLLNNGTERGGYHAIAQKLGLTEGNVRVSWLRLKDAFVRAVRAEVAETVADPNDIDAELRYLFETWFSAPQQQM